MNRQRVTDADAAIGQAIKRRRVMLGMTQGEFAAQIGISYQQAHKYEMGLNRVSAARLMQIAAVLGVELAELLPGAPVEPEPVADEMLSIAQSVRRMSPRRRRLLAALARELSKRQDRPPDPSRASRSSLRPKMDEPQRG
jgi:transcriptional regulator with XRE-family HTH domain